MRRKPMRSEEIDRLVYQAVREIDAAAPGPMSYRQIRRHTEDHFGIPFGQRSAQDSIKRLEAAGLVSVRPNTQRSITLVGPQTSERPRTVEPFVVPIDLTAALLDRIDALVAAINSQSQEIKAIRAEILRLHAIRQRSELALRGGA